LWQSAGGWFGLLVIVFVAPRARKFAQFTIPDLLETRYNTAARVLGTIAILFAFTAIASYQFRGGSHVLRLIFPGLDEIARTRFHIPAGHEAALGMIIVATFVIIFTAFAGMTSVAYLDVVIGLLATVTCIAAVPILLAKAGGWSGLHAALPQEFFGWFGRFSVRNGVDQGAWTGFIRAMELMVPTMLLLLGNQTMYQKFFSARSERDARLSVLGWIIGTIVLESVIVLLAMTGGTMFRDEIESGKLPAWGIIPYMARHGVTSFVGALFLAAIFAKVVSTGNNYLFSPATSVVHDVFQRFLLKKASDRTLILVSRIVVAFLGLLALAQAFQPSILATAVYAYDVYGAGITPAVVSAFFWKRTTTAGGLSSIVAGTAMALFWKIAHLEEATQAALGYSVPMIFPALAASLACLIAVSLLTPIPREEQWRPFFRSRELEPGN
jgi:solute:Na+ symporter, SSS family